MIPEVRPHPRDGALMTLVPAGPFLMGLPEEDVLAEEHERPLREVYLPAFWIDLYPVTNARFNLFLEAGGYDDPRWWHPEGWPWCRRTRVRAPAQWNQPGWTGPDQPAAGVSWYEADAYARWAGRRLPTDAEWEKAARGTDGRRYPWGADWPGPRLANFDNALGRTSPVGLYPEGVSPYGCHDMAGNVNNWTADWYWDGFGRWCLAQGFLDAPVLDDALRDRLAPGEGTRVDRGGGFATPLLFHEVLGCTRKVHDLPRSRQPWNGFRTVCAHLPAS